MKKESPDLVVTNGEINFVRVNFKYLENEERSALKSINLNITGKKTTALVGLSGAGKSTILNLIPKFYKPLSGKILIDGQSIDDVNLYSLRKNISYVSQETSLFDDTIRNNIMYANPLATENEFLEVCEKSYVKDFIENLPNKYDSFIGENGLRLSGGEKQRLSIARAMLKKSSIILLDEATSSLDAETEDKIQKALNILTNDKTTVVIAHRLSTILKSEKIYVINNGQIENEGNHQDLLSKSKIYKNFYDKQIKKS